MDIQPASPSPSAGSRGSRRSASQPPALQTALPVMERTGEGHMTVAQWMANKQNLAAVRKGKSREFYESQNKMIDAFVHILESKQAKSGAAAAARGRQQTAGSLPVDEHGLPFFQSGEHDDEEQLLPLHPGDETDAPRATDTQVVITDEHGAVREGADGPAEDRDGEEEEDESGVRVPGFPFFATPLHAARWSLVGNIVLLCAVAAAMAISGSLAVLSSFIDLTLDLFGGVVVWFAHQRIRNTSVHKFPVGKQRYEQIAVLAIACVMSTAAFEIILMAIQDLVHHSAAADISLIPLVLIGSTVAIKVVLFYFCRRIPTPSARALTVDHKNDCFSNSLTLVFVLLAGKVWAPIDQIGAIIIAILIIYNWVEESREHVNNLSGRVASPDLIQKLTFAAMVHSPLILKVDTVRAYQMGSDALAEVDIVLSPDLPLKEAHDVAESLQHRLERIPGMARAFVHIDTEFDHSANDEHKPL